MKMKTNLLLNQNGGGGGGGGVGDGEGKVGGEVKAKIYIFLI